MRLMTQDDTQNECVCVGKQEVILVMLQCHMFALNVIKVMGGNQFPSVFTFIKTVDFDHDSDPDQTLEEIFSSEVRQNLIRSVRSSRLEELRGRTI